MFLFFKKRTQNVGFTYLIAPTSLFQPVFRLGCGIGKAKLAYICLLGNSLKQKSHFQTALMSHTDGDVRNF